ncbi:MAG: TIGR04168 family protein [Kaiparowitsia implicata GSE-PSE-MK54-09C]|jgi:uncharacterized protein (TIGR04168 family)|nr:TIGR04168 family protein [Kaiparowitsia implicata GSE-PSE-MK54-09C]
MSQHLQSPSPPPIKKDPDDVLIAVVGDVHDQWDAHDARLLHHLGVDLVLLVGDFGNESVEVVRAIARLDLPKAVIMGNHDAWYSATEWGRRKCPYDRQQEDWVQQQLQALGETHVGYGCRDFAKLGLSVVGGRPFSWGGAEWKNETFYRDRFGVTSMAESTERIVAATAAAAHGTLVMIGHCGPAGLGHAPEDPCGRDWKPIGGDFGDPDLQEAIAQARANGKTIPLVAFGHMHHNLRHRRDQLRRSLHIDAAGTVYLNAARVPRIVKTDTDCLHNVTLVTLRQETVAEIQLVWIGQDMAIQSTELLYRQAASANRSEAIARKP